MKVEKYPENAKTLEMLENDNPCDIGDEVILEKRKANDEEYDALFGERNKVKTTCIGIHRFFINFSDGLKTYCINKADLHTGAIKIELAR